MIDWMTLTIQHSADCRFLHCHRDSPYCRRPLRQLPSLLFPSPWVQTSRFEYWNPCHTFPSSCLHRQNCLHSWKHLKTYISCLRSTHAHFPPLWANCLCSRIDLTFLPANGGACFHWLRSWYQIWKINFSSLVHYATVTWRCMLTVFFFICNSCLEE